MYIYERRKKNPAGYIACLEEGASLRITLPKKVSAVLSVNQRDIVGFYLEGEKIIIEKMK